MRRFWRLTYRGLCDVRNALDVLIAFARARAYPKKPAGLAILAGGQP